MIGSYLSFSIFRIINVSIKENIEEAFKIEIWPMIKKLLNRAKEIKSDIEDIK